jgi:GT2 family glycosyltransferase
MDISVIIVNYNVRYFLEQCLFSVQKAMSGIAGEVWVVDNASQDGSLSYLEPKFPNVHFIKNEENTGFAKANNLALKSASGSLILFLNPDTIIPEDCFTKCIDFFNTHPDAGAIGVKMLDGKGHFLPESKRSFPSPLVSLFKLTGCAALFPRSKIFGKYHLGHLDQHQSHSVDVLAGAFMMVRKKVLDITGGFDENFFMYGEDVDLSYRIQATINPESNNTFKNYYVHDPRILHFKGESTKKGSLNYVRMFYVAMSQFVQKHYSSSRAGLFNLLIRGAIWFRALISLFKQLIKKTGLPVLDAMLIWIMFWITKKIWAVYIKPDIYFSRSLINISFSAFSFLFLLVSYYTGLYQKKFRFRDLWRSGFSMMLILLAIYSLLPETLRFSRGIVVMGSLMSIICLGLWRNILLALGVISNAVTEEEKYTLIVGTQQDAVEVAALIKKYRSNHPVKGVISPIVEEGCLGTTGQLQDIVKGLPVRELIFCESPLLRFSDIIAFYQQMPRHIKLRIHGSGSASVIGSDSKFYSGETIGALSYRLSNPIYRRSKRLTDIITALLLFITLPLHILLNRKPIRLINNIFMVLSGKKTWVGYYSLHQHTLPALPAAVLGPTGLPASAAQLNADAKRNANEWYAMEYEWIYDIKAIFQHYQNLSLS